MIHLTMLSLDSREIVQNVFSPMVGAVYSPLADEICQKNNLSFVEMLQPFTRLSTDGELNVMGRVSITLNVGT